MGDFEARCRFWPVFWLEFFHEKCFRTCVSAVYNCKQKWFITSGTFLSDEITEKKILHKMELPNCEVLQSENRRISVKISGKKWKKSWNCYISSSNSKFVFNIKILKNLDFDSIFDSIFTQFLLDFYAILLDFYSRLTQLFMIFTRFLLDFHSIFTQFFSIFTQFYLIFT